MRTQVRPTPGQDSTTPTPPEAGAPDAASGFERLFGIVLAVVFCTLLGMVFIAREPLRDADVWWHLVMGHAYLDGLSVRHPGPMSPFGTQDWHSRDWLTQMLMAGFDDAFGLPGVAWLRGLALVVLFIACFRVCRHSVPFGPATVATGAAFFAMLGSLSARPQLVSFVLLAVLVGALVRTMEDLRPRWWLALLTALWACTHGMWFLSLGLQVVVLVGLVLDRRLDRRAGLSHVGLLVLSAVAVGVTPNGVYQLTHPFGESMGIAHYIQEYEPVSVVNPLLATTVLMFAATAVTWARRADVSWAEVLLAGTGLFFALYMGRTIAVGAILLMPFFARAVHHWWPGTQPYVSSTLERVTVYGGAVVALVALAVMVPSTAAEPDKSFPVSYDDRLSALPADAVLLNELGDGGFLAWKYPDLRIVGDGLADQYSTEWMEGWFDALLGRPDWQEFVEESGADYALLNDTTPLRLGLLSEGWTVVQAGQDRLMLKAPEG